MLPARNNSIFLNPNFKSMHVNPMFLKSKSIHVNPKFVQDDQKFGSTNLAIPLKQSKIIQKTRNKIVREPYVVVEKTKLPSSNRLVKVGKRKLIRAELVSQFNSVNEPKKQLVKNQRTICKAKYKVDRRPNQVQSLIAHSKKKLFISKSKYALIRANLSGNLKLTKVTITGRKLSRIGLPNTSQSSRLQAQGVHNKKLSFLNINGVLYKSTGRKLQKTITKSQSIEPMLSKNISERVLFIKGDKFILDQSGCSLTRIKSTANMKLKRIDIGGLTYVAKSANVFIRTNVHYTRNHLSSAKHKSISFLSRKLVKSNIPCPIFRKVGKCAAFERGKCPKVHDRKHVAICPRYLKGECQDEHCLLSHDVTLSKMPTCKFFLQGCCIRNECPYLHKKVNHKTEICGEFLKGFCQLADKCNKRHEFLCPEFERLGKCKRIKCPFPHRVEKVKKEKIKQKTAQISLDDTYGDSKDVSQDKLISRYFVEESTSTRSITDKSKEEQIENLETINRSIQSDDGEGPTLLRRPKLGVLPAFIPL